MNASNEKTLSFVYYICPKCGNTFDATNIEAECSFRKTPKEKYFEI